MLRIIENFHNWDMNEDFLEIACLQEGRGKLRPKVANY
jgi:hypothetical protein